jgi:hypothetical protein
MSRILLQQALDALKYHTEQTYPFHQTNVAIELLKKELAKPEQAKYSDIVSDGGLDPRNKFDAPPRKEWVGLTDDERDAITKNIIGFNSCSGWEDEYAKAIETKLREKNNAV